MIIDLGNAKVNMTGTMYFLTFITETHYDSTDFSDTCEKPLLPAPYTGKKQTYEKSKSGKLLRVPDKGL